eukprot:TRINITY_DN16_c0_g2_i1.p1 TRINITY_DN16_c0_g2~~TRINITY_DN16_c0_g2_i1.p1  ORF type:complete len:812 (-),score=218.40 TRINITY_DN16_c0_g2_i1:105-2432(-)
MEGALDPLFLLRVTKACQGEGSLKEHRELMEENPEMYAKAIRNLAKPYLLFSPSCLSFFCVRAFYPFTYSQSFSMEGALDPLFLLRVTKACQGEGSLKEHRELMEENPEMYAKAIRNLAFDLRASPPPTIKARIAVTLFLSRVEALVGLMDDLLDSAFFSLPDLVKTVQMLDGPRRFRQLERKIQSMKADRKREKERVEEIRRASAPPSTGAKDGEGEGEEENNAVVAEAAPRRDGERGGRGRGRGRGRGARGRRFLGPQGRRRRAFHHAGPHERDEAKERKSRKQVLLEQEQHQLEGDLHAGSLSTSFVRRVKQWTKKIPVNELQFFFLTFPLDGWKYLIDICHMKPTDFQFESFPSLVFGGVVEPESFLGQMQTLGQIGGPGGEKLDELFEQFPEQLSKMFSFVRTRVPPADIPASCKKRFAALAPLEDVLWHFDELACEEAVVAVQTRLEGGEQIQAIRARSNYGKLMQHLFEFHNRGYSFAHHLMPHANERLGDLIAEWPAMCGDLAPPKTVVMGDASSSMTVAIQSATIIGALLAACMGAELEFFNHQIIHPPKQPKTAEEVFEVANTIKADGSTSPAVLLSKYYQDKTKVDVFVVVSDEGENIPDPVTQKNFSTLFRKYRTEVNPKAEVVFVSFLSAGDPGAMLHSMDLMNVQCKQFRFDLRNPDLKKFDALLGFMGQISRRIAIEQEHGEEFRAEMVGIDEGEEEEPEAHMGGHLGGLGRCQICRKRPANACSLDCFHLLGCTVCAMDMQQCPECGRPITKGIAEASY